ncbi:YciI family protein [Paramicrobacterium agarici]|nr:YciI family protein [Microbacterium agarici]
MTHYMISFPSAAMDIPDDEFQSVVDESHAVIEEAKKAGVYVFGGGLDDSVVPVRVSADGTVTPGTYPQTAELDGGFTIIDVATRDDALEWAAKIAASCRCAQEVRAFAFDPAS